MLTIFQRYAVKHLKNGVARLYIADRAALESAGLTEDVRFNVRYEENRISAKPCSNGTNRIMATARGLLLELKNKATGKALKGLSSVSVTFNREGIVIGLHHSDRQRIKRELSLIKALQEGSWLDMASFFSGLGALSYHLKKGLEYAAIESKMVFANDSNARAMSVNLEGNPIWDNASNNAVAVVDKLEDLELSILPGAHLVEVGYPCVSMTTLCPKLRRDLKHPVTGSIYVKLCAAIEKINPAIVVFECAPHFVNSETLRIIQRELNGYRFENVILNAHDFGEIETRRRSCVVATSCGLPPIELANLKPPQRVSRPVLGDYLESIPLDSDKWRSMDHIKRKHVELDNNFKNTVYTADATAIGTVIATYSAPKAGSPMVQHPIDCQLQRQLTPYEHGRIRQLPEKVFDLVMRIANGRHPLVQKNGSITEAHNLLGNGVSKRVWQSIGFFIGEYLSNLREGNVL